MKLDLEFSGITKLKDWWKQVQSNFGIIETEVNKIDANMRDEVKAEVSSLVNSTNEYMEAIENFSNLYAQNGNSVDALEAVFGERLRYNKCTGLDADAVDGSVDAVYICSDGAVNVPYLTSGVLFNFANASVPFQVWVTHDDIHMREVSGEWSSIHKPAQVLADNLRSEMKSSIVFGKYTGNGEAEREIYLGFTPTAVEVYRCDGLQNSLHTGTSYHDDHYGGLALKGQNCYDYDKPIIVVKEGGFKVYYSISTSYCTCTNENNVNYYFKAYRDFEITEV